MSENGPPVPSPYELRRLAPGDAEPLVHFYNGLSEESKRTFRPIGVQTDLETCEQICFDNSGDGGEKYDLIVTLGGRIVGWCFIWGLNGADPALGLGIDDDHQSKGLGNALMSAIMAWATKQPLPAVHLTVVRENTPARKLYESFGFVVRHERVSDLDGLWYCDMVAELAGK